MHGEMEQELTRLEATVAIENLVGRYAFYEAANQWESLEGLFVVDNERISVNLEKGESYTGLQRIRQYLRRYEALGKSGLLVVNALASPSIQVLEGGQSAVGDWVVTGHETLPLKNSNHSACWQWMRYKFTFLRVQSSWRIYQLDISDIRKFAAGHVIVESSSSK